jgi:hypothetical protein
MTVAKSYAELLVMQKSDVLQDSSEELNHYPSSLCWEARSNLFPP